MIKLVPDAILPFDYTGSSRNVCSRSILAVKSNARRLGSIFSLSMQGPGFSRTTGAAREGAVVVPLDRTSPGRRTGNGQVGNHTHHHSFMATRYGAEWPPKSGSPLFIGTFAACVHSHFASSGTRFFFLPVIRGESSISDQTEWTH
jgi:hypothetical protein